MESGLPSSEVWAQSNPAHGGQKTYGQFLGPLAHVRGPPGRRFVWIHVQFVFVEKPPIQLLDRKCHFLHGAQLYKCEAAEEGDTAAVSPSQNRGAGRASSPLWQQQTAAVPNCTDKPCWCPAPYRLLQASGGERSHFMLYGPGFGLLSYHSLQKFKAFLWPWKSERENTSWSSFLGQPRLRQVEKLTSSKKTEQGHYQKQTHVFGLFNQGLYGQDSISCQARGLNMERGFPKCHYAKSQRVWPWELLSHSNLRAPAKRTRRKGVASQRKQRKNGPYHLQRSWIL